MEKDALIELIKKSKSGDIDAMEKILLHAHTSVSYQCRKMLKNEQDVEDMTQEILITVYQKLDTLQEPAAFNQWLKKITAARCINSLNRTHIELQFAEDEEGHSILDTLEEMDEKRIPEQWMDNIETTRMIEEIVNGLPDAQRMCTLMFYYSEMSVKEMAHVLKVSENTVKSRLNYARKAIKEKVQDYEKQGIKLYGISPLPFLLYFLLKSEKDTKDPLVAKTMVKTILAEKTVSSGITAAAGSASSASTSGSAASAAGTSGIASMFALIPVKVIAGVVAVCLLLGGAALAASLMDDSQNTDALVQAGQKFESEDALFTEPDDPAKDPAVPVEENSFETDKDSSEEKNKDNTADENALPGADKNIQEMPENDNSSSGGTDVNESEEDEQITPPTEPDDDSASDGNAGQESHVHSYTKAITKEANCCFDGTATYTCLCGNIYSETIPQTNDHSFTLKEGDAADGSYVLVCTNTGEVKQVNNDHSHRYTASVTAPACTESGYTVYTCNQTTASGEPCTDSFVRDETEPLGHDYLATEQLTCDQEGILTYECIRCDDSYETVHQPVGHVKETIIVEPTEETDGYMAIVCKNCSYSYKVEYHEHVWGNMEVKAATCTEEGYRKLECKTCDLSEKNITPSKGHNWSAWVQIKSPTESSEGEAERTCSRCSEKQTRSIAKLQPNHEHSYTETITKEPTCNTYGAMTYTCDCGDSYTETIPFSDNHGESIYYTQLKVYLCVNCGQELGRLEKDHVHSYQTIITYPTCTSYGRTTSTCICGDDEVTDITPPTGHNYQVSTPLSCTESGVVLYECSLCSDSYTVKKETYSHDYQVQVVEPTETEEGYTEYTCSVCGDSYRDSYTAPIGAEKIGVFGFSEQITEHTHDHIPTVTEATCTGGGCITYSCECGDSYTSDETDSLGHSYESTVATPTETEQCYTEYTCIVCGDTYTADETEALGHSYESAVAAPTETEQGDTEYTCTGCWGIAEDCQCEIHEEDFSAEELSAEETPKEEEILMDSDAI